MKDRVEFVPGTLNVPKMTEVAAPSGVTMAYTGIDSQDRRIHRFGLTRMYHGGVNTYRGVPGRQEYVNGSVLVFDPGGFYVYATRQNLVPTEINRLGILAASIYDNSQMSNALDKVLGVADWTTDRLRMIQATSGENGVEPTLEDMDAKTGRDMAEAMGLDPVVLREKRTSLREKYFTLAEEAYELGAAQIRSLSSGPIDIPLITLLEKRKSE